MMKTHKIALAKIYVPAAKREIDTAKVQALAESIMADGQRTPIHVRPDGERYVLVEGAHRLEACRALGEATIDALVVQARRR